MGLLGLYLPFLCLCKSQGIWNDGFRQVHMGYKRFSQMLVQVLGQEETPPWARWCNKLHFTMCIVPLSEFVSRNTWLQHSNVDWVSLHRKVVLCKSLLKNLNKIFDQANNSFLPKEGQRMGKRRFVLNYGKENPRFICGPFSPRTLQGSLPSPFHKHTGPYLWCT